MGQILSTFISVFGLMAGLIFVYLVLANGTSSIGLTNAGFTGSTGLVKALQGR